MYFIKGPSEIKGMFQVLDKFSQVVRYRIAFLFNKVHELSIEDLEVKNFFNFVLNSFTSVMYCLHRLDSFT